MRLTLRTMLAYLDDILDPSDAQDLGHKIEESEFATSLVGRIRDVSRRLRLGAPKLTGKGMGLDPNTVAEYLDNTLSVARVPEFEKICLESDMHLAEVACSHQILALVLGEPAEVNPASRQMMYKLLPRAQDETFAIQPARERAEPRYQPREKAHVPDYLREERSGISGWMKIAAAVLVLAALSVAVLMAVGPFARPDSQPLAAANLNADAKKAPYLPPAEQPADAAIGTDEPVGAPSPPENSAAEVEAGAAPDSAPQDGADAKNAASRPGADKTSSESATAASTGADDPPAGEAGSIDRPVDNGSGAAEPAIDGAKAEPADENAAPLGNPEPDAVAPPAEPPREAVGRFISDNALLRYANDETGWLRLAGQSTVSVDDRLLSLPTFRSTVALSAGVTMQLVGETDVTLGAPDATGVPELNIAEGRLVLMSAGRPGAQVRIAVGELRGTITLVEVGSVVGIEVRPTRIEGTDPESEPPLFNVELYVASGQVIWVESAQAAPLTMNGPQRWSWPAPVIDELATKVDEPWILGEEKIEAIDKRASKYIGEYLVLDRPVRIQFKELADDRRSEIRSLAVRCLATIGDYDALVRSLGDQEKRSGWEEHVNALRNGLARSPEGAVQVRSSLDRLRAARSTPLYRMLWGYSDAQLKAGAANQLVEYLDDENLDLRVVSFCTLERISGQKSVAYRPTDNPKTRQPYLQKWRKWAQTYQPAAPGRGVPTLP